MTLIDTHTHLDTFAREGVLAETLARARAAELEAMITVGTSPEDWQLYRGIAKEHPGFVFYTVGLHPCSVDERWTEAVAQLEDFWSEGLVLPVAIGEVGLDRHYLPRDNPAEAERIMFRQRAAFAAQLELARRLRCVLVVHAREAFRESVDMIDASGVDWSRVVYHCFSEGPAEMAELVRRGGRGSFTGVFTYKSAGAVREAAKVQGLDKFMLETDAPYLAPVPLRGKPNEPAFLKHTAEFAATEFSVSLDELARRSTGTARQFYGLTC